MRGFAVFLALGVLAASAKAAPVQPGVQVARLPIEFEANQGQHDPSIAFLSRAAGYQVGLTADGAVFARNLRMRFHGSRRDAQPAGEQQTGHATNYFRDDGQYVDVPNFERVVYREVYPGVDAVFYGSNGDIEYDFVLRSGADPRRIELTFEGARKLELDAQGDLLVHTDAGVLRQKKPVVYQEAAGGRKAIASRYRVLPGGRVRFDVAAYDKARPLTVDPILSYSTYIGGGGNDTSNAIAVDAAGNAYITGQTSSTNFPAVSAYHSSLLGVQDVFVAKLNPQGNALVYSTYVGGRKAISEAKAIAIDANGSAYITGTTTAGSYPVTSSAYSAGVTTGGGFVTKLSPAGNVLTYSTYIPGAAPAAIAVDASGGAYIAGQSSGSLPTTAGALQGALPAGSSGSGFVTKLNPTGTALAYSTYLGGAGSTVANGLTLDAGGNAYVVGATDADNFPVTAGAFQPVRHGAKDAFVSKLNAAGSALVVSTYLGGAADDNAAAIALDASGRMYVVGDSYSVDFPKANGYSTKSLDSTAYNVGFITILNPDGAGIALSTLIGGNACLSSTVYRCSPWNPTDGFTAVWVDPSGTNIYVAGFLSSIQGPDVFDPVQAKVNGRTDAYAAKIVVDPFTQRIFNFRYATRLGGTGTETATGIGVDALGNAYITGTADTSSFPTTQGTLRVASAGFQDAFVAKISTLNTPLEMDGGCAANFTVQLRATMALNATGNVTFMDGTTTLATVPMQNGVATYSGPAPVGAHKYTAVRASDGATGIPIYCKFDQ